MGKWPHTPVLVCMDLLNELMKIVYPFGGVGPDAFAEKAAEHMTKSAAGTFGKLEGFVKGGPYMCGDKPQSGDFHVFEMLDQHQQICAGLGIEDGTAAFPKLKALHAALKAEPTMAAYFADASYAFPHNNPLPPTNFTNKPADYEYPVTSRRDVM